MPRKLRTHFPGALYHVTNRGNNKNDIFLSDEDRKKFLYIVGDALIKFDATLHTYCLMDNHIHLAIQVSDQPLHKVLHNISSRYANWLNWKNDLSGHLFQARYYSVLVENDSYYLELMRYIHQNPVKAGICSDPVEYQWSSHRCYMGLEKNYLLSKEMLQTFFSGRSGVNLKLYEEFINRVETPIPDDVFDYGIEGTYIIGSDDFITAQGYGSKLKSVKEKKLEKISIRVCTSLNVDKDLLNSATKDLRLKHAQTLICWIATELNLFTQLELSTMFCCSTSTLSRSITKAKQSDDKNIIELKSSIIEELSEN